MKLSFRFLWSVFFFLPVIPLSYAGNDNKENILRLEFNFSKKINIWIRGAQESDVRYQDERQSPGETMKNQHMDRLVFAHDVILYIKNVKIEANNADITINDIPMNKSINAVIMKDGEIKMNAFIRDFD